MGMIPWTSVSWVSTWTSPEQR